MSIWVLGGLIALFVGWHFIPKAGPPTPSPRFRRDLRANAGDADWKRFVEEHCESPAETAFLTAMIEAHGLLPRDGSLHASGLKLDLQVGEGRYRVDFLANDWLVIEIDGAAWHGSEAAQARDRQRDAYFEGLGYSVLRIPAKTVFTDPGEAVRRVASALAMGKREIARPVQESGFARLGKTMSGLARATGEMNDYVTRQRAIQAALRDARQTVSLERTIIDSAISGAVSEFEVAEYIGDSEERRREFEEHMAMFGAVLAEANAASGKAAESAPVEALLPLSPPLPSGIPDVDASIQLAYADLVEEQRGYLESARQRMRSDPRLRPHVENLLTRMGYPEIWPRIS